MECLEGWEGNKVGFVYKQSCYRVLLEHKRCERQRTDTFVHVRTVGQGNLLLPGAQEVGVGWGGGVVFNVSCQIKQMAILLLFLQYSCQC